MKKDKLVYDLELYPNACYKMEYIHNKAKENFESIEKWLYLGADIRDRGFAKVGLTMGDLTTRSSSSANPNYYLFCAFKCQSDISRAKLESIEKGALKYLDDIYTKHDGSSKRAVHAESGRLSECFYDIDFMTLFNDLHYYLYQNHCNDFILCGFESNSGFCEGEFLNCEFNKLMSLDEINRHRRSILQ